MKATTINVQGMTCGGCVASVTRALQALDGVDKVSVSLERKEASVDYDPARIDEQKLRAAIEDAGFDAP